MILTEKTKRKSYCCNKPIYIEKIGSPNGDQSSRPYCSKCLKFPEASTEAWLKIAVLIANTNYETRLDRK